MSETFDNEPSRAIVVRRDDPPKSPLLAEQKPLRYSLPELKQVGEIMFASGMFRDLKSVQQAMVKLLAGAELGYGPFRSLEAFHVIEGKPSETAAEISARIKASSKYRYNHYWINAKRERLDPVKDASADTFGCVVVVKELVGGEWEEQEPVVFTLDDAKVAGLASKDNWRKYSRDMLFARAISAAGRQHCADLFGGPAYTPDDLGADVLIDATGRETLAPPPPPVKLAPAKVEPVLTPEEEAKRKAEGIKLIHAYCSTHNVDTKGENSPYRRILMEEFPDVFSDPSVPISSKSLSLEELRHFKGLIQAHVRAQTEIMEGEV
jgi:hypothetical protein